MAASEKGEVTSIVTDTDGPSKGFPALKMEQRTDKACRLPAASTLSASFSDDPVFRWCLTRHTSPHSLISNSSLRSLFFASAIVPIALAAGGTIVNPDGEWGCTGLLIPPGKDTDSLGVYLMTWHRLAPVVLRAGWGPTWKAMIAYPSTLTFLRKTAFPPTSSNHFKKLRFYYVFFLGTLPAAHGRGLGGAFMRECQRKATEHVESDGKKGVPIYFECSKESSRLFYEHLGFKTLCMVRVGKGEVDENGFKVSRQEKEEGKAVGAKLWALVWWPEGMWPEGVRYWDEESETEVK